MFWLGFVVPLGIAGFVVAVIDTDYYKAKVLLVAPLLLVVASVKSRRAYRELRR
jgi:hypothetical protein